MYVVRVLRGQVPALTAIVPARTHARTVPPEAPIRGYLSEIAALPRRAGWCRSHRPANGRSQFGHGVDQRPLVVLERGRELGRAHARREYGAGAVAREQPLGLPVAIDSEMQPVAISCWISHVEQATRPRRQGYSDAVARPICTSRWTPCRRAAAMSLLAPLLARHGSGGMSRASKPSGKLELNWTNKEQALLAHEDGSYEWGPA